MIGVDTNVLLRLLLQDDAEQSPIAAQRVKEAVRRGEAVFVSSVVLAELAWVLRRKLKEDHRAIAAAVSSIITSDSVELEDEGLVEDALADFRSSGCDFADALIGRLAARAGCATILTFDRKAAALETFTAMA